MRSIILIFAVISILSDVYCRQEDENSRGPTIQTKSGQIRGHYLTSYKSNKYAAFQGIPFALPPVGERRFQPPVPVEPWTEELQATELKDVCLHDFPVKLNHSVAGSEDCLYLNVYVPTKTRTKGPLPVIFYLYGGAFRTGETSEAQEKFIIDHDVIFASANYRTGVLGFLSTEDEVVPGNMGLKDQSAALRWLHNNVAYFGGDSKRITLLGGSSGAISVQYHYLSPWSRGLFHAGISLSGNAFDPIGLAEHSREKVMTLGRLLLCNGDDVAQVVNCLRNSPAQALVNAQNDFRLLGISTIFGPVVEKGSANPFIADSPIQLLKQGKAYDVPWVIGIVAEEGLTWTAGFTKNETLKVVDGNWDSLAPTLLEYQYKIPKEQRASVAQTIRKHYFGRKPINRDNLHLLTDLVGHRLFGAGAVNAAKAQAVANQSPVFFAYYDYRATDSYSNWISNSTEDLGVAQGDDLLLVIGNDHVNPTKSSMDMDMQRKLIKIWTSVAYNGVPDAGVDWQKVRSDDPKRLDYLHIVGPDDLRIENTRDFAQIEFWNSIGLGGL